MWGNGGGGDHHIIHGHSAQDRLPTCNAGTDHVGFSPTRQGVGDIRSQQMWGRGSGGGQERSAFHDASVTLKSHEDGQTPIFRGRNDNME